MRWRICATPRAKGARSEEHTSELQSPCKLVCRLLLEKKKNSLLRPSLVLFLVLWHQRGKAVLMVSGRLELLQDQVRCFIWLAFAASQPLVMTRRPAIL